MRYLGASLYYGNRDGHKYYQIDISGSAALNGPPPGTAFYQRKSITKGIKYLPKVIYNAWYVA